MTRTAYTTLTSLCAGISLLSACAVEDTTDPGSVPPPENPGQSETIDQARLASYRAALPKLDQLTAAAPEQSVAAYARAEGGTPAIFPAGSHDIVIGINGAVTGLIFTLDFITSLPPTVFNSESQEFVWGPFENDDGVGYVAAYIRDTGSDDDFRYHYALLRGIDNDLANLTPVIWGGATPDEAEDDHGVGIALWDFEANRAFEEAHNPNAAELDLDEGRFAVLFGKGFDEQDPNAEVGFVLAAFRDFVSQDDPSAEPADLDYFYGRVEADGFAVDFLDWEAAIDVDEPADGSAEDVGVRMAFLNQGIGRAEVDAVGGSLDEGAEARVVECWDNAIEQTHLSMELVQDGVSEVVVSSGEAADCGLFAVGLDTLGVPSLDDIDDEMRGALSTLAETGMPPEAGDSAALR